MPQAIGSMDATHIGMGKCPYMLRHYHKSFKLDMPTRTYNLTTNHRRQILSTTQGHPGCWNNKTLVLFNDLAILLRDHSYLNDYTFLLYEQIQDAGGVRLQRYKGAWLIVDNGYLPWSSTIPPVKHPTTYKEMRFSKWCESMRQDVECVFGILEARF